MRPALLLGGLFTLLTGTVIAVAQTGGGAAAPAVAPKEMVITREVEVRCGGSDKYYATTRLRPGDRVTVLGESPQFKGWLVIKPPPGSYSWINALFLSRTPGQYSAVVVAPEKVEVPVLAGSSVFKDQPNVEVARVPRGEQVVILGKEEIAKDKSLWLPIQPTPKEVRYLPADAVQPGTGTPVAATPGAGPLAAPAASPVASLIDQANKAYAAGNLAQADALYRQAANQTPNANDKSYCWNQISQIEARSKQAGYAQPGHPANSTARGLAPGQTTSLYGTSPAAAPATPVSYSAAAPQWSGWGTLRKTALPPKDGRPMYALVGGNGQVLMYALAPNVSLDHYLNRMVCLYGPVAYSPGEYMRMSYMTVSHVALP